MLVSLTLHSITCNQTSGLGDQLDDELIVVVQPDAALPISLPGGLRKSYSINTSSGSWVIDRTFSFSRDLLITLYDHDESVTRARSDYLVSQVYTPDNLPTSVRLRNPGNGAEYTIQVVVNG
ncbi:hypothetical protein C7S18_09620 [Ahniella affigens]|uniref:Uncharacterized protein n=1 Tax=Ahniella affigens TaxID=2021234 RepID=A0A2P1PRJ0_9GAMM|nr:hypothetical protein [Ahniella affigens]AVP97438.1 hypothetical protein C7S18_09620 [Ahniella affigens]